MSLVKEYYLRCDGCGVLSRNAGTDLKKVRRRALGLGWKRQPGSTSVGKDFCSRCASERGL
jgi:hypothetical protein